MRTDSLVQRHPILVNGALLAAHLLRPRDGFRLKDVQFYFELFANWIEFGQQGQDLSFRLVQVQRYLKDLEDEDCVNKKGAKQKPLYRLTHAGVVALLKRTTRSDRVISKEEMLLIHYFLIEYRNLLMEVVFPEELFLTQDRRRELERLIDPAEPIRNQLALVTRIVRDLEVRIEESHEIVAYTEKRFAETKDPDLVLSELSERFSYQLAHQKPFEELFREIPRSLLSRELTRGFARRTELLFKSLLRFYRLQKGFLEDLAQQQEE